MLTSKINNFVAEFCPDKDKSVLITAIFRYVLRLSTSNELIKTAKVHYGLGGEMRLFKKSTLDSSKYTLSRFWRGIYLCIRSKDCRFCKNKDYCETLVSPTCSFKPSVLRIAKALDIDAEDMKLALTHISREDIKKIKNMGDYREWPCDKELEQMLASLKSYAQYLKFKYLKFVENNYAEWGGEINVRKRGLKPVEKSPLVNDLLGEGYRIALKYDYKLELSNIKSICMSWMHNYAINLIKKCNTRSRQNLVSSHRKISRKRGMDQEFTTVTSSFDADLGNKPGEFNLYSTVAATDYTTDVDKKRFINKLKYHSHSKKCKRFIDIIVGKEDIEFEFWLTEQGLSYDTLTTEKISNLAQAFLKLSRHKLQTRVGILLKQELGEAI